MADADPSALAGMIFGLGTSATSTHARWTVGVPRRLAHADDHEALCRHPIISAKRSRNRS
jgi:hypothetical protein